MRGLWLNEDKERILDGITKAIE